MTRILIISRYYPPEVAISGVCLSEIAKRFAKLGHEVTVLTTVPNYPTGVVPAAYRGRLIQEETLDGVRVVRIWSYAAPNKGYIWRTFAQLSFGCLAPILGWKKSGDPEVVIVSSPPLFNVIAGRIVAWLKRRPLVLRVADLWPESAVKLGVLHNSLLIRLAEWLEWTTYQQAGFVWTVTEGIYNTLLQRGLSAEHIFLSTNGVDTVKFHPMPRMQARKELGWDGRFTVLYAGNHGLAYGMTTILDAAELLQHDADIHFILVGYGVKKAELIEQAKVRYITNITFLDPVQHERMPLLLGGADVCLIPLRNVPFLKGTLPVKMFEMMACGRPFVLGAKGIARDLVEREANAGIVVEPENAEALVSTILYLRAHPEEAEALGLQGREYVRSYFDYDQITAALDARIETLLEKQGSVSIPAVPAPVDLLEIEEIGRH